MPRLPETMTKRELINYLERLPDGDDTPVYFAYNYGDYSNTQALGTIQDVDALHVTETAYSRTGWCIAEDEGLFDESRIMPIVLR